MGGRNYTGMADLGPNAVSDFAMDERGRIQTGASSSKYVPVVPSDTEDLPDGVSLSLWVAAAGTVNLNQPDGTARDGFPLVPGENRVRASRIRTGGTAADIWAMY